MLLAGKRGRLLSPARIQLLSESGRAAAQPRCQHPPRPGDRPSRFAALLAPADPTPTAAPAGRRRHHHSPSTRRTPPHAGNSSPGRLPMANAGGSRRRWFRGAPPRIHGPGSGTSLSSVAVSISAPRAGTTRNRRHSDSSLFTTSHCAAGLTPHYLLLSCTVISLLAFLGSRTALPALLVEYSTDISEWVASCRGRESSRL
jgi:hypothetical protein